MVIDPLKDYPGYALRRASAASMARLAQRLEPLGLRPAEATVLMVIGANPGITQSEVGRLLEIASANMAPLTSRLGRRGLIVRRAGRWPLAGTAPLASRSRDHPAGAADHGGARGHAAGASADFAASGAAPCAAHVVDARGAVKSPVRDW